MGSGSAGSDRRDRDQDYDRTGYPQDRYPRSRKEERMGSAGCFLGSYVLVRGATFSASFDLDLNHCFVWQCIFGVLYLDSSLSQQLARGKPKMNSSLFRLQSHVLALAA